MSIRLLLLPTALLLLSHAGVWAQASDVVLRTSVVSAGGAPQASDGVVLHSTLGQPVVGRLAGASLVVGQGFWPQARPAGGELGGPLGLSAPLLVAPADGAEGQPTTVRLQWQPVTGAASYDLQVATDDTFLSPEIQHSGLTATEGEVEELAPSTTYFWRVRGVGESGPGPFSAAFRFTTATNVTTEAEAELPDRYDLRPNYPNPFNPATTITYALPEAAPVRLTVYDAHGRLVQTLVEGAQPPGLHQVRFEAAGLASGVYLVRLEAGAYRAARTMLLVK